MKFLAPIFLSLSLAFITGCATSGGSIATPGPSASGFTGGDLGAGFTSDESRTLVLQSQKLLAQQDEDYRVGADDVLEVRIFEWQDENQSDGFLLRVSQSGSIPMPGIGAMQVAGMSVGEVQSAIISRLSGRGILSDARVSVSINEFKSKLVSVIGSVASPGRYALTENVATLLEIISLAGGPTSAAGNEAFVLRNQDGGNPLRMAIDLDELFRSGSQELDAVLSDGDTVYIPKAALVYVYGAVRNPGAVSVGRSLSILEAISSAGGLTESASENVKLVRKNPAGGARTQVVNLSSLANGRASIPLREGDNIVVDENETKEFALGILDFAARLFTFSYRLD